MAVLPTWSVVIIAAGALFFVVGLVGSASVWSEVNDSDTILGAASRSSSAVKWSAIAPLLTVSAIGVLIMGVGLLGGRIGRD